MISSLHSVQMKSVAIVNCINSDVDIPSSCNNFVFFPYHHVLHVLVIPWVDSYMRVNRTSMPTLLGTSAVEVVTICHAILAVTMTHHNLRSLCMCA